MIPFYCVDFKLINNQNINNLDLDTINTNKSPKNLFFSHSEDIAEFKIDGKNIQINQIEKNTKPFILFGVKACDVKSFDILDKVFLADPIDEFYKHRRDNCLIFSLACNKFDSTCFCQNFNINPLSPKADIETFKTTEYLLFNPVSLKGYHFLNKYTNLFLNIDFDFKNYIDSLKPKFNLMPLNNLDLSVFTQKSLMEIFESEKWNELSSTCLGCGSCTFFCPTCQCYDIRDFKGKNSITRYRCWDSCMYSDFTLVAGGGNPRKTQKERFRQRFMHKLVYSPKNLGEYGCVGCGRCLKVCPNSLNIVNVIKKLGE